MVYDRRWTPFNVALDKYDNRITSGYGTGEDCAEFDRLYNLKKEYLAKLDVEDEFPNSCGIIGI